MHVQIIGAGVYNAVDRRSWWFNRGWHICFLLTFLQLMIWSQNWAYFSEGCFWCAIWLLGCGRGSGYFTDWSLICFYHKAKIPCNQRCRCLGCSNEETTTTNTNTTATTTTTTSTTSVNAATNATGTTAAGAEPIKEVSVRGKWNPLTHRLCRFYPFICQSVLSPLFYHLFSYLSIYLIIHSSTHISTLLLSVHLTVYLSTCTSPILPRTHPSLHLSIIKLCMP